MLIKERQKKIKKMGKQKKKDDKNEETKHDEVWEWGSNN